MNLTHFCVFFVKTINQAYIPKEIVFGWSITPQMNTNKRFDLVTSLEDSKFTKNYNN